MSSVISRQGNMLRVFLSKRGDNWLSCTDVEKLRVQYQNASLSEVVVSLRAEDALPLLASMQSCLDEMATPELTEGAFVVVVLDAAERKLEGEVRDATEAWLCALQVSTGMLPEVNELKVLLQRASPVKINVPRCFLDRWKTKTAAPDLLDKVFTVNNVNPCVTLVEGILRCFENPPISGRNYYNFHCFWDLMTAQVLGLLLTGTHIRGVGPDYLYLLYSVSVFRGAETAPSGNTNQALRDLKKALIWTYGDAPYVIGYTAVGYNVALYALTSSSSKSRPIELSRFDLSSLCDRVRFLLT